MGTGDFGDRAEGVGNTGRGLVVSYQDCLDGGVVGEGLVDFVGVDGLAVGSGQLDDICAEGLGYLDETGRRKNRW